MLTMAAATNVHGVFQIMLVENGHDDWTKEYKMYDYELGPMPENYDLRWRLSPASHVEKVSTPVFVMHGEVESPHDSSIFVEKLREHNKDFIYKTYPGEGYSIYGFENRLQSLLDKLAFYDKHFKNEGEGVSNIIK
jgi:dipeptidyl aminopeptidase/acylaminoacyl peptidase